MAGLNELRPFQKQCLRSFNNLIRMNTYSYFQVISVEMRAVECKQGIQPEGKKFTKSEFLSEN